MTLIDATSSHIAVLKSSSHNRNRRHQTFPLNFKGRSNIHTTLEVHRPCSSPTHCSLRKEMYIIDAPTSEQKRNPLFAHILDNRILEILENPSNLESYDNTRYLDKHVKYVGNMLDY